MFFESLTNFTATFGFIFVFDFTSVAKLCFRLIGFWASALLKNAQVKVILQSVYLSSAF